MEYSEKEKEIVMVEGILFFDFLYFIAIFISYISKDLVPKLQILKPESPFSMVEKRSNLSKSAFLNVSVTLFNVIDTDIVFSEFFTFFFFLMSCHQNLKNLVRKQEMKLFQSF